MSEHQAVSWGQHNNKCIMRYSATLVLGIND